MKGEIGVLRMSPFGIGYNAEAIIAEKERQLRQSLREIEGFHWNEMMRRCSLEARLWGEHNVWVRRNATPMVEAHKQRAYDLLQRQIHNDHVTQAYRNTLHDYRQLEVERRVTDAKHMALLRSAWLLEETDIRHNAPRQPFHTYLTQARGGALMSFSSSSPASSSDRTSAHGR